MILRCVLLCLALGWTAGVTVDDQGYQNILISFAPNIPGDDGNAIITNVQEVLENTSSVLHTAIGIRIASVTFRIPPSWNTKGWKDRTILPASLQQMARDPDIKVDFTDLSPFGTQPVALQHGGCGVPGHQIVLPLEFLGGGGPMPQGQRLAREWLKYRYGVFEENGHMDDDLYPSYYRVPGTTEIRINECTNSKVNYIFKRPITDEVCDMDLTTNYDYCRTRVEDKSAANVTSSLMYYHKDLPNMKHICGKDGRPHHSTALNKQNALCDGQSVWEVVKSSEDFKNPPKQPVDPAPKPIQFSYIQESNPRFVVLLEDSDNQLLKETPILFALRQFYYNLPPRSKLAIYSYNTDVTEVLSYRELPAEGRADLGTIGYFAYLHTAVSTSKGIAKAAEVLLSDSAVQKGSILLITASPLDKVPDLPAELRGSEICVDILRFADESTFDDRSYDDLAQKFRCFSHLRGLDAVRTLDTLTTFLHQDVPKIRNDRQIKTVASGEMSAQIPLKIPRDKTASQYTLSLSKTLEINSIVCNAKGAAVDLKLNRSTTNFVSFTFDPVNDDVTCKLLSDKVPPVLTQVQMKTREGEYFVFDTWVQDKSPENEQLPIIIHVKLYFGGYPVKNANVETVVHGGGKSVVVKMLDNGHGAPDVTQYDGIYSGYFAEFLTEGQYQISVRIDDNKGFAKYGKIYEALVPDSCCGSKITSKDYDLQPFQMGKILLFNAKGKSPAEGYPPAKIRDLQAKIFPSVADQVILTWTAPGEEKAGKYIIKLFESRDDAISKFDTTGQEVNNTVKVTDHTGTVEAVLIPFGDLNENVTYFAAIRSLNAFNKPSPISNVAEFVPKQIKDSGDDPSSTPESTTGGGSSSTGKFGDQDPPKGSNKAVGIVLGVLGGVAVIGILGYLGYYFKVKKPRRN